MDFQYQLRVAKKAGDVGKGQSWLTLYKSYLACENARLMTFDRFRALSKDLAQHLKADPDGKDRWRDKRITWLLLELGA